MRKLIGVIIFMSFLSSIFPTIVKSEPNINEKWAIAKVTAKDGKSGVFRYLEEKPSNWKTANLSEEVSISWNYSGEYPDSITLKKMDELEVALEPLASGRDACLALIMTVNGLREWCYYTRNYDYFMAELNKALSNKQTFPISIIHSRDPEWEYYQSFVDKIMKK
jgi:hypothetical protein